MTAFRGAILLLAVATWSNGEARAAVPSGDIASELRAAYETARKDCPASLKLLQAIEQRPDFGDTGDAIRLSTYVLLTGCYAQTNDIEKAYQYVLKGTQFSEAPAQLWNSRLAEELHRKNYAAAVVTIEQMGSKRPDLLNGVKIRWLFTLYRELDKNKDDPALRRRFLKVVASPSYEPEEVGVTADSFRKEYASLLVDEGDRAGAAALVKEIDLPSTLISVSLDSRLRDMLPADFDVRAAVERRLANMRDVAASHPGSMAAVLDIASLLRDLGRADEALATLEAVRPTGAAAQSFTDLDEQQNWWWDGMAYTYQLLGRYDEAVAAFRHGIESKESGQLNVSQTINLAHAQVRFGRPKEALTTLAPVKGDHVSGYGEMQVVLARGCANLMLGNTVAAKSDIDYAIAHEGDAASTTTYLLLCAADLDRAAAGLIRRLDDPKERSLALRLLSDFAPPPPAYPEQPYDANLRKVKMRPDVQAAIARAGGTRRFNILD